MNEQIVILDFGSQYTQVIARRIRECNVYSTIVRYDTPVEEIKRMNAKGIILSGGPSSVLEPGAPFIQFTYGLFSPLPRDRLGIFGEVEERVLQNLPPASVWVYRKPHLHARAAE